MSISRVKRINVVARSILRLILGSRTSVPIEVLYAGRGTTPVLQRRSWITANCLLKLSNNAANSTYSSVQKLFHNSKEWPIFSTPCVVHDLLNLKRLKLKLFTTDSENHHMKVRPHSTHRCAVLLQLGCNESQKHCLSRTCLYF